MLLWKYPSLISRSLLSGAIFRSDADGNRIYLTFDDGPHPDVTPRLLDILDEYDAQASFFVVANSESWWDQLIKRISERGHVLGLHGIQHRSGYSLSNVRLWKELESLREAINAAGVTPLPLYRPPFGHVRPDTIQYLKKRGVNTVLWTHIPGDFKDQDSKKLFSRATRGLKPGDIIVMHDGCQLQPAPVLELTRRLLTEFERRNWQPVSLA
jgi:peptidoglycan/xylan/chitin deacetylase (PgdA/CDA1 family)